MIKIPTKIDQAQMQDRLYCFGFLQGKRYILNKSGSKLSREMLVKPKKHRMKSPF